jgi:hypothetical protein
VPERCVGIARRRRVLLDACSVAQRRLVARIEDRPLAAGADREHDAGPVACADERVAGAWGAMEEVPGAEQALLAFDEEQALAAEDEEALLVDSR